ncbi:heparinase II/III-family protein [Glaciecola sp. MF2-115]|uniref:heparinase II/III family protein n=1 Tax=Glaciecola sp. MF2-115 TaxID=3384827 RepID=UPI0039A2B07D
MILIKAKTAIQLGFFNLIRVFAYQLGIKTGLNKVKKITSTIEPGDFFSPYNGELVAFEPNNQWSNTQTYFGKSYLNDNDTPPDWKRNCLNGKRSSSTNEWHQISDFDDQLGDIKGVWEASRFDWLICFAQLVKRGDDNALEKLNGWISNWLEINPPYSGVNWKCGQEASIRVMHIALSLLILEQTRSASNAIVSLVKAHLKRISPTIMYAVAQDNNHGTSEAAALFIGGSLLDLNGDSDGLQWKIQGEYWLGNRAKKLIGNNGSFSQYSVSYHRVMLDTYSLVEVWRRKHHIYTFDEKVLTQLKLATNWLFYFTNLKDGDAPNIGANDGARLIPLTGTNYRDFRPSVQLASVLFLDKLAYSTDGNFNLPLLWLDLKLPVSQVEAKAPKDFSDGGYFYLNNIHNHVEVYLRYPQFKFRPSQCDAMHLDLWLGGVNVLRDGGTYSYNAGQEFIDYYGGSYSHNNISFDEHDQMPRLSRFLLGDWLKTDVKSGLHVTPDKQTCLVGYKDRFGCAHSRSILLKNDRLVITDYVSGFQNKAVVRFRLAPAVWKLVDNKLTSELCTMTFKSDLGFNRVELKTTRESRYYYQETNIPSLELEVSEKGQIITEVIF